ncbi:MAG: hypothetical protein SGPRY_007751 [Prymnesium sp.]
MGAGRGAASMRLCALPLLWMSRMRAGAAGLAGEMGRSAAPVAHDPSAADCCGPQFTASRGSLLLNGKKIHLKGLSWFGFEGNQAVVDGLWQRSVDSYLDFMVSNHFNAIRVPLALNNILFNPIPSSTMLSAEPSFVGGDSLGLLENVVMRAASKGILVLLDMHRLNSSVWPDPRGLWYNDRVTFEMLKSSWTELARRFCKHWNVFGADLLNEPHGGTWGSGHEATDWDRAAELLGNNVLRHCARWVVFVEGIGQAGRVTPEYFWGENLEGLRHRKLSLHLPDKLVYSPHVYVSRPLGPGLWRFMHYFNEPRLAETMPRVWHTHFGFLLEDPTFTLVLGEFGGPANKPADIEWQRTLVDYLTRHGHVSSFYWCLNPNAGDTGGLLKDDWKTPNQVKLDVLRPLHSSSIVDLLRGSPPFSAKAFGRGLALHEAAGAISQCRTSNSLGGSLVAKLQFCNGVAECTDHSDEESCSFAPCVTVAGPDTYSACRLPFFYNGSHTAPSGS